MDKNFIYLTPGPTQVNAAAREAYSKAISSDIAAMSHRGEKFQKLNLTTKDALRSLLAIPPGHRIFWLSSGTEAWERVIQNGVITSSFHFVNGAFSERFYRVALELERQAQKTEVPWFESFDLEKVSVPEAAELLALTHNETSTGVMLEKSFIEQIAKKYPEKLIAVDAVSSAPYAEIPWPLVDYTFFSVQKFFGLPAGLGALVVSPRAIEKAEKVLHAIGSSGSYHNLQSLVQFDDKNETPATPNVIAIYALGEVCQKMLGEGIQIIRKNTDSAALRLYQFFDSFPDAKPAVVNKASRSSTVLCLDAGTQAAALHKKLADAGLIIGSGYGKFSSTHLRIANFWRAEAGRVVEVLR